ncbi:MAG TPA: sensor domain-containing diguanylate cyclase [Gemmatimonas aurantiaca]|uniref:Sensor domain-containing diguanylate cyclase n=2 Tax=Gemmatimonas aurantiaca TaxID=173480 RepID=A0A3D4V7H9_9BACT|nr:sensor domain-containing diguanylate cyclase [Gemmatimonas aurantiaca]BAH38328.1 putative signaling protein [Gemmatimonas aurantiaca T-27]HCT57099.1 sensor domain-containing diguanylate cyclase [Gemmatimonas aurantiaca]
MSPEALLDLFLLSPVGLVEVDEDGRVEVANLAARRLLTPFTRAGSLEDLFTALSNVAPDLSARVRSFDAPRGVIIENLELLAPGQHIGVFLSLVKVATGRIVAVATDASGLAVAQGTVSRLEQRLRAVEEAVRDYAFYSLDREGCIDSWSVAAERVHQWSASAIIGKSMTALLPQEQAGGSYLTDTLALAAHNGWCEEEGHRARQDGTTFWASTVVTALRDAAGETTGYSVISHDVSERRKLEEQIRDDASSNTDYLTGVLARRAYFDVAQSEVARARRYSQPLTMLLVDPDHFRDHVEQRGEAFANEWLRAIAWVCRQESRNTDVVGRVGGEAFAVLLPSTELSGGLVLAERIRERMQRHVFGGDFQGVRATLSIGVAEVTEPITSVDGLLSTAGTAVDRARQAGRNLVVGYDD